MPQNTDGGLLLALRQDVQQFGGKDNFQKKIRCIVRETAGGLWVAIAIGDVGLDVENGCAVHQVGAAYMEYSAVFFRMFHSQQLHAGQSQLIGSERGPGGEHTHAGIAT